MFETQTKYLLADYVCRWINGGTSSLIDCLTPKMHERYWGNVKPKLRKVLLIAMVWMQLAFQCLLFFLPSLAASVVYGALRSFTAEYKASIYPVGYGPSFPLPIQAAIGITIVWEVSFWGALIAFIAGIPTARR